MLIKTCGLREPANLRAVAALDVDWLGLIFYPKSPRYMGNRPELKAWLADPANGLADKSRVGVFVNATFRDVLETVDDYGLDYVQLHGGESAIYCATLQKYWRDGHGHKAGLIRAFRVSRAFDFGVTVDYEPHCDYFLFDTKGAFYGGTGHKFDWSVLDRYTGTTPFLLSGGIGPEDAEAVRTVEHPRLAGIDLNSRFELEPGVKDVKPLEDFILQIKKQPLP